MIHLTGRIKDFNPNDRFINIILDSNPPRIDNKDTTYSGDTSNVFASANDQKINLGAMGLRRKKEYELIEKRNSFVLLYEEINYVLTVVGVGIIQNYIESYETSSRPKNNIFSGLNENDKILKQNKLNNETQNKSYIHSYDNVDKDNNNKITIFKFPLERLTQNSELYTEVLNNLSVEDEDLNKFKGRSYPVNSFLIEKYITKMIDSIIKIKKFVPNFDLNEYPTIYSDLLAWKQKIRNDLNTMKNAGENVLKDYLNINDIGELDENECIKNDLLKNYLIHYNFDQNDFKLIPLTQELRNKYINAFIKELEKQIKEIKIALGNPQDFNNNVIIESNGSSLKLICYYPRTNLLRESVKTKFREILPEINQNIRDNFNITTDLFIFGTYQNNPNYGNIELNSNSFEEYMQSKEDNTYQKMIENPYSILIDYFINIDSERFFQSFLNLDYGEKARHRSLEIDFNKYNIYRLVSIITAILLEEAEKGDIWVYSEKIKYKIIEKLIEIDSVIDNNSFELENLFQNTAILNQYFKIIAKADNGEKYVCLIDLYNRERSIEETINRIIDSQEQEKIVALNAQIDIINEDRYKDSNIAFTKMQNLKFLFVSGVAGSGKSFTLCKYLDSISEDRNNIPSFLVVTPTGKSAQVLKGEINSNSNFTNINNHILRNPNTISHIHYYLRDYYNSSTSTFDIPDYIEPKEIDILVIDEISMIDLILFTNLLKVVKPNKLILLGDIKQLPPINGYGNISRTIERYLSQDQNQLIYLANMTTSLRSIGNEPFIDFSLLLRNETNTIALLENKFNITTGLPEGSKTLDIIKFSDEAGLLRKIERIYKEIFQKESFVDNILENGKVDNLDKLQILTLTNNDNYASSKNINNKIKNKLYYKIPARKEDGSIVYITKIKYPNKYMRLKNEEVNNRFFTNGMIGSLNEARIITYYDNITEQPSSDDLEGKFADAYALSVHKSQGSGFNNVILVLPKNAKNLTRELLYTAITRPKKDQNIEGKLYILLEEGFQFPSNFKFSKNRNMSIFNGIKDWCEEEEERLIGNFKFTNELNFNRKPDLYLGMLVNYNNSTYTNNYGVYEIINNNEIADIISTSNFIKRKNAFKILPSYTIDRDQENKVDFIEENTENTIITHNGLRTRSWSEAILMLIFDNLQIPYFYEVELRREKDTNGQPINTYKLTYSNLEKEPKIYRIPDFTIVSKYIENFQEEKQAGSVKINDVKFIIEHLGMLSNEDYKKGWQEKVKDYYTKYKFDLVAPLCSLNYNHENKKYTIDQKWEDKDVELCKNAPFKEGIEISDMKICFTTDEEDINDLKTLTEKLGLLKDLYKIKEKEE